MVLSNKQASDYDTIKGAILDQMGLSAKQYRQMLQVARWSEGTQLRVAEAR